MIEALINKQPMTKERLEQYRSMRAEIKELEYKIGQLYEGDSMVGNDVILDYRSGYPMPQTVVGVDMDKLQRTECRYKKLRDKLQVECLEIEEFIDSVQDSTIRRIFRMRYIDGKKQYVISQSVHLSQSAISKKMVEYLEMELKS